MSDIGRRRSTGVPTASSSPVDGRTRPPRRGANRPAHPATATPPTPTHQRTSKSSKKRPSPIPSSASASIESSSSHHSAPRVAVSSPPSHDPTQTSPTDTDAVPPYAPSSQAPYAQIGLHDSDGMAAPRDWNLTRLEDISPLPLPAPSPYLLAEHLEFFENEFDRDEPTYGVIGIEAFYRIYFEKSPISNGHFFSSPGRYLQCCISGVEGVEPTSASSSVCVPATWEVEPNHHFLTAKVNFTPCTEQITRLINSTTKLHLSFFYTSMVRNEAACGTATPIGKPISGCPRPLTLEHRLAVEERQQLTRLTLLGQGHYGLTYLVRNPFGILGALKEVTLPYTIHRHSVEREISLLASFSRTFHSDDNPFGNSHNTGLEHLLRLTPPGARTLGEPSPASPLSNHKHIAQIHAAFVDPISRRAYHLLEYYSGGDMSRFLEGQRNTKESVRKEHMQQAILHQDYLDRQRLALDLDGDDVDVDSFGVLGAVRPSVYHLPMLWIRTWSLQFCFALRSLKEKSIVHADIAPRNVFFRDTKYLDLVIGDFGMARCVGEKATSHHALDFHVAPHFRSIAPELESHRSDGCPCGGAPSFASDVWSCGAILLRCMLLPGTSGEDDTELVQQWASWSEQVLFEWIDQAAGELPYPTAMWEAVKGMMRVNPVHRSTLEQAMTDWVAVAVPNIDTQINPGPVQQFDHSNRKEAAAAGEEPHASNRPSAHESRRAVTVTPTPTASTLASPIELLSSHAPSSLFTQLVQSLANPQPLYTLHSAAHAAKAESAHQLLLPESSLRPPPPPEVLQPPTVPPPKETQPVVAASSGRHEPPQPANHTLPPPHRQPSSKKRHLSPPPRGHAPNRVNTPNGPTNNASATPPTPTIPSPKWNRRTIAGGGSSGTLDSGSDTSGRGYSPHISYTPSGSGVAPTLPTARGRSIAGGSGSAGGSGGGGGVGANAPSPSPSSFFAFDVHPPKWRYFFRFLDFFLPMSIRTLRPTKLQSTTSRLFFDAPRMLFQVRFCIFFMLLECIVGLWGIIYQFARRANPHLAPTKGDEVDYLALGGIIIFEIYCVAVLVWLKYYCRDTSLHPRIGNATIFAEILVLVYSTYESSGVGLSFYLVLFSIPTLSFMLVDWRSGLFWQSCCLVLLIVVNIVWQVDPDRAYANPPTLQNEHDVLIAVGVFLLLFLLVINFIFRRYQSIVHHHLDLALKQLTLQNDFITRTSMSKMKFLNQMSHEIEQPLKEMTDTLDRIIIHHQDNSNNESVSLLTTTGGGSLKVTSKLRDAAATSVASSSKSLSSTLTLPQSQALTLAYLNSLHVQGLIRDMIDVSIIEHYQHQLATSNADRAAAADLYAKRVKICALKGQPPPPPPQPTPTQPPLHMTTLFPFKDETMDFVKVFESAMKSISLAIARRGHKSNLAQSDGVTGTPSPSPPTGAVGSSSSPSVPRHFGRELLLNVSPLLYRDCRFIGDVGRVSRVLKSLVRNALAWSDGDETVAVASHPRSYGMLKSGTPYVFVETNITFVPNYTSLGTTLQPSQFGLWNFQHPADEINIAIIQHMNGRVWMSDLEIDTPASIAMGAPVKDRKHTACINVILMFTLTRPYDVHPISRPSSLLNRPASPSVGSYDISRCNPPSMSELIYRTSAVQLDLSSRRTNSHASLVRHAQQHLTVNTAAATLAIPTHSPLSRNRNSATISSPTSTKTEYFDRLNVLVVDPHTDARVNLLARLRAFGVNGTGVDSPAAAFTYLSQFKDPDDLDPAPIVDAASGVDVGGLISASRLEPLPDHQQPSRMLVDDDDEHDDEDIGLLSRIKSVSGTGARVTQRPLPGAVDRWTSLASPSARYAPTISTLAGEQTNADRRGPMKPSSLIIFVNLRMAGSTAPTAEIGGIEFILSLIDAHPHWLNDTDRPARSPTGVAANHRVTLSDLGSFGSSSSVDIAVRSSGAASSSSVTPLLSCPHILLLTSWSSHGALVDEVECAHMDLLTKLPLQRPVRVIKKPIIEEEIFEVMAQVRQQLQG